VATLYQLKLDRYTLKNSQADAVMCKAVEYGMNAYNINYAYLVVMIDLLVISCTTYRSA